MCPGKVGAKCLNAFRKSAAGTTELCRSLLSISLMNWRADSVLLMDHTGAKVKELRRVRRLQRVVLG